MILRGTLRGVKPMSDEAREKMLRVNGAPGKYQCSQAPTPQMVPTPAQIKPTCCSDA
jgi:hypothetical protein